MRTSKTRLDRYCFCFSILLRIVELAGSVRSHRSAGTKCFSILLRIVELAVDLDLITIDTLRGFSILLRIVELAVNERERLDAGS